MGQFLSGDLGQLYLGANSGLEIRKIEHTVEYLLEQCEDVTPLALQKALYYIQGFHYAFYGAFPFSEDCEAWVHGPVYREIFEKYRVYRYDPTKKKVPVDFSGFPSTEKAIMDSVIKKMYVATVPKFSSCLRIQKPRGWRQGGIYL